MTDPLPGAAWAMALVEVDHANPSYWGSWTKCLKRSRKDAKKMC